MFAIAQSNQCRIMNKTAVLAVLACLMAGPNAPRAQQVELTDEVSRGDLLRYAASIDPEARSKAFPDSWRFSSDAESRPQWLFGIDVSHYDGKIDWTQARAQNIRYAYVKATQGVNSVDKTFQIHWPALAQTAASPQTKVYRGAYHFLSAEGDAAKQAQNFLSVMGTLGPEDLPPTMDLEWDVAPGGGDPSRADRWRNLSAGEIAAKVKVWLEAVEAATGRTPVIYTAASWWKDRMGQNSSLSKYPIWIADYSAKSQLKEAPRTIPGSVPSMWQFTEHGRVANGFSTNVDVNIFKGQELEFRAVFKLPN